MIRLWGAAIGAFAVYTVMSDPYVIRDIHNALKSEKVVEARKAYYAAMKEALS